MTSAYKIAVISDLHLREPHQDSRYPLFIKLLERIVADTNIQELWLMGDVFDIMIGSFNHWKIIHPDFFRCLANLKTRGASIVWVQGNHDFQLDRLMHDIGVEWIPFAKPIERAGVVFHLEHGDLANAGDVLHYIWRWLLTSKIFRIILKLMPDWFAFKVLYPLTLMLSRGSRAVSNKSPENRDKYQKLFRRHAERRAQSSKAHWVVLGHNHISELTPLSQGFYFNVGSWFDSPQIGFITIEAEQARGNLLPVDAWLSKEIST